MFIDLTTLCDGSPLSLGVDRILSVRRWNRISDLPSWNTLVILKEGDKGCYFLVRETPEEVEYLIKEASDSRTFLSPGDHTASLGKGHTLRVRSFYQKKARDLNVTEV